MVRETRHLWVGNLPDNVREERIREHFQRWGPDAIFLSMSQNVSSEDSSYIGIKCVCICVCVCYFAPKLPFFTSGHWRPPPFFFPPSFPLGLSSTDPFSPPPNSPSTSFYFLCVFSLLFILPSILGFLSPIIRSLSFSDCTHARGGGNAAPPPATQKLADANDRFDDDASRRFFRLFAVKQLYYIYTLIEFQS